MENRCVLISPLCTAINRALDENNTLIIAIEGGAASGKTTLSAKLKGIYDCNVFHTDDFFLQADQRTKERSEMPGENMDWERLLTEVLEPLREERNIIYRTFDCHRFALAEPVNVPFKRINIVEGVYSMHPQLAHFYDLSVFLNISPARQAERIMQRNTTEFQKKFFTCWIPMENAYFSSCRTMERCNLILEADTCK